LAYKTAASNAGLTIEEYLQNYLYDKGFDGWTLYEVGHIPLGSGDMFYFKKCFGYESEPDWEYHVALTTQEDAESYVSAKESEGWMLLAVNYVNWEPGAVIHFRKSL
jgi:hypothetical protein